MGQTIAANLVRVSTVLTSSSGSERESVDSIKFNAPRYYTTQNRAIPTEDYTSLIKFNFPALEAVCVYGDLFLICPTGSNTCMKPPWF